MKNKLTKKVIIELTQEQFAQFDGLWEYACQQADKGERGLILGQLSPAIGDPRARFIFVPYEKAKEVVRIVSPKKYRKNVEAGFIREDVEE